MLVLLGHGVNTKASRRLHQLRLVAGVRVVGRIGRVVAPVHGLHSGGKGATAAESRVSESRLKAMSGWGVAEQRLSEGKSVSQKSCL